ncbi:hypothetical protein Taro_042601 [Colocasia esculenta]|uniref:Uncharacterized protein n=1 Tax=Colocasia esculenta TaxID=4460 RepID=A0A843WTA6_COLES|nr:hypothetical protein [Colocasia esculenta]
MIRQDFRSLVLEIREGVEPQIWGTTSFRYGEQTHEVGSSPDFSSPGLPFQSRARKRYGRTSGAWFSKSVKGLSLKFGGQYPSDSRSPGLPFQSRARKRYDRTSGAWFSKSVKGLSLKFGGQHPSGMENRPMESDRAQISAVQDFLFKAVRENDTAGLSGLGSRNP